MTKERKLELMLAVTKAFNPLVTWLLKSSLLHGLISKDIVLLHFEGRKSGRWFATPVTYVEEGGTIKIASEAPWSRNLRACPKIKLTLRGKEVTATAVVHEGGGEYVEAGVVQILTAVPRDAPFYRVRIENGIPNAAQVQAAAIRTVLIDVTLDD